MEYLSAEWFDSLRRRLERAEVSAPGGLCVAHRVTGAPSGEVIYYLRFDDSGASVVDHTDAEPDVGFSTNFDCARAIAHGRTSAQAAFLAGELTVTGDVQLLIDHAELFRAIDAVEPDPADA